MILNRKNLEIIFNYIESQLEDDDGRGEFDEETSILNAVDRTIDMFEDDKQAYQDVLGGE
jgi:hypothetical protein|tara:strand:- start:436 stop:615 length:180 start_codon:yes stop_codon:yes gene_type:complete